MVPRPVGGPGGSYQLLKIPLIDDGFIFLDMFKTQEMCSSSFLKFSVFENRHECLEAAAYHDANVVDRCSLHPIPYAHLRFPLMFEMLTCLDNVRPYWHSPDLEKLYARINLDPARKKLMQNFYARVAEYYESEEYKLCIADLRVVLSNLDPKLLAL